MSDTTSILSLMSRPEVELVKGKVMPRVGWEWLLGFGVTYFSLMSKAGEILVTLPKVLWQDFQAGTEVWVLGTVSGERMGAEMIFFPHSQKYIQLIQTRRPPIWTALILALTGLVLLTQDVMWVLYYLGIPALLLPMFVSMATSIPRRCSYEGWQLIEHDLGMYTFEFPLGTGSVSYYKGVRGMLEGCQNHLGRRLWIS